MAQRNSAWMPEWSNEVGPTVESTSPSHTLVLVESGHGGPH